MTTSSRLALAGLAAVLSACTPIGPFVWADDYAAREELGGGEYRLAVGDLIAVKVFNQEGISARERVRRDGMVTLPLLRDVKAAGLTPNALAEQVQVRLKEFVNAPVVSVSVEESRPLQIPILGEVTRQGQFTLDRGATVLEALAAAGGLNELARRDRIFVLRREPKPVRIRCSFEALAQGQGRAAELRLQPGDTIVVE